MDKFETIKNAISNISGKRAAAKINKLMPDIDQRIQEGISHKEILDTLEANGITINLHTFRSILARYRKSCRNKSETSSSLSKANSNLPSERNGDVSAYPLTTTSTVSEDMLDARKRDALGEKYLHRKKPVLNKRNET